MVVTLCLNVSVCHQKHGENDGDNIPTREDKSGKVRDCKLLAENELNYEENIRESLGNFTHMFRIVPRRESDHKGYLQQTDLKRVGGTDFHTANQTTINFHWMDSKKDYEPESNISIQSKRNSIHKFCGIRDEREERHTQEFLIYA